MNKADKAESLFRTGYNCSQSVYAAFAEELGITVEEAAKKASPFGCSEHGGYLLYLALPYQQ